MALYIILQDELHMPKAKLRFGDRITDAAMIIAMPELRSYERPLSEGSKEPSLLHSSNPRIVCINNSEHVSKAEEKAAADFPLGRLQFT